MKAPLNTTLDSLLNEYEQEEKNAFNVLYSLHFKALYRKIYYMVKDESIADELVQDLFLKLWQKRKELDVLKSVEGYIYRIAENLVFDYFRKEAKNQRLHDELQQNSSDGYMHSDQLLEDKERRTILCRAIDQLSPQRKLVFTHCKLEGHSYEEASISLGISVATVNTHMTHSLRIIKEYVLKNYN